MELQGGAEWETSPRRRVRRHSLKIPPRLNASLPALWPQHCGSSDAGLPLLCSGPDGGWPVPSGSRWNHRAAFVDMKKWDVSAQSCQSGGFEEAGSPPAPSSAAFLGLDGSLCRETRGAPSQGHQLQLPPPMKPDVWAVLVPLNNELVLPPKVGSAQTFSLSSFLLTFVIL